MVLTMLVIFLCSIWVLWLSVTRMLRADIQRLLGDQQVTTVALLRPVRFKNAILCE
jgi:hypothetical protein